MRDLIVSIAIVAVLIGGWLFFDSYSADQSMKCQTLYIQILFRQ